MSYRPDPTRRSRTLGTPRQGRGQNNRNVIPRRWRDSVLNWGRGHAHSVVTRLIWGRAIPFLVEPTRPGSKHACTVDDIATLLNLLPEKHIQNFRDINGIQGVVLRQPTRKEQALSSVWARLGYGVQVDHVVGPVIFIESQEIPLRIHWGKRLSPMDQRELDRIANAASQVERSKRGHDLEFDLDGVRRVQLFQSLPHEVGHWADMFEHVELPSLDDFDKWESLWNRYFQRPTAEREEFAHRYAERVISGLEREGAVPFDRMLDPKALVAEGLRLDDFRSAPPTH